MRTDPESVPTHRTPTIGVLGGVAVQRDGQTVYVGEGLTAALLSLLALRRARVLSTDHLADELWGDDQPKDPRNALQRLVARLRRALPADVAALVLTRRPGYTLQAASGQVDAEVFDALVVEGRELQRRGAPALARAKLTQAQRLWRGDPFGGLALPALRAAAARLEETALSAVELRVEADLALGDHHAVLAELESLVARHPLRERLTELLMVTRYRAGRQAEALQAYRDVRRRLIDELGVEPGSGLERTHAAVLAHGPSLDLPAHTTRARGGAAATGADKQAQHGDALPLLGRGSALSALTEAWDLATSGRRVLVQVEGEAGSGKSRLLETFAERLPSRLVQHLAAFAADREEPGRLHGRLALPANTPTAILLDDAADADPTSLVLFARRHAEPGGGLMVWAYRPSAGLPPQPLQRLADAAGREGAVVTLRVGRLTVSELQPLLADGVENDVATWLVQASGGAPRALEDLVVRLQRDGTLVREGATIRAVGIWPPAAFPQEAPPDPDVARVRDVVCLAGRPVPAVVLATFLGTDDETAWALVERLVDHGALREDVAGLVPGGAVDADAVVARLSQVRKGALRGALADAWDRAGLVAEAPGAVGGYYLAAGRNATALPLLAEAGLEAWRRDAHAEAFPLIEGALTAAQHVPVDTELRGRLLLARAVGRTLIGPNDGAIDDALEATRLLSGEERARAFVVAAEMAMNQRDLSLFAELARQGHDVALREGVPGHAGELLGLVAVVESQRGEGDRAEGTVRQALSLVDATNDPRCRSNTYQSAGWLALERGSVALAAERLQVVLAAGGITGTDHEVTANLFYARALSASGRISEALVAQRRAARWLEREGLSALESLLAGSLTDGLLVVGRYADALAAANQMLALAPHASTVNELAARIRRGRALAGLGKVDEAELEVRNGLDLCPPGEGGHRLRITAEAVSVQVAAAAGRPWEPDRVAALCRALEAAHRPLSLVEVLTARTLAREDAGHARRAAELALELGAPMHAARAAQAGGLWDEPVGRRAADRVRAMADNVPARWRDDWAALPEVAPALRR